MLCDRPERARDLCGSARHHSLGAPGAHHGDTGLDPAATRKGNPRGTTPGPAPEPAPGPIFTFTAELWEYPGKGAWIFVSVPPEQAEDIRSLTAGQRGGFGSVKVAAAINLLTLVDISLHEQR
ncbi:MAG: DUF1905 domain-containing protein [Cryobacterium sp.]|nr:DUF1905 domain-containing protein [Cryobacterium sp.]